MADNGVKVEQKVAHVLELTIRFVPETGEIRMAASAADPVTLLGMLEFAKVAMIEQRAAQASGKGPSLIVPGRFAS
jgi:hypothetical protein